MNQWPCERKTRSWPWRGEGLHCRFPSDGNSTVMATTHQSASTDRKGDAMKTRRLITILPAMTLAEASETMRIHRITGLTGARTAFVLARSLRAPRHTISAAGLIGGGVRANAK